MNAPASPASGVFIAGTDTGIGKTLVSCVLLHALRAAGLHATGMKPVASGCAPTADGLRNDDALALIAASDPAPEYTLCNPYAMREPIAPHLAAAHTGVEIRLDAIHSAFDTLSTNTQCIIVEGVGGWAVPLSSELMLVDLVRTLRLPVILVVGLRLGCLNHAQLSARAILADGCELIGWIGNRIDPAMACVEENIVALRERLPAPCLGIVPYASAPDPRALAKHLGDAASAIAVGASTAAPCPAAAAPAAS